MSEKKRAINYNRAKQIFVGLAQQLLNGNEGISAPNKLGEPVPLTAPFMIRAGIMLQGAIAGAYFEAVEELNEIVLKNQAWSKDTVANVLASSLARVLDANPDQRSTTAQDQAHTFVQELKREPGTWDVGHQAFGIHHECTGIRFGNLLFDHQVVHCEYPIPDFPSPPSEHQVCFANVRVEAINQEAALDRAAAIIDRHLAVLNTLCAQSVPVARHLSLFPEVFGFKTAYRSTSSDGANATPRFTFRKIAIPLSRADLITILEKENGKAIDDLLRRQDTLADRLISAYEIAGAACVERLGHISFLLFAIALESAVLGKNTKTELTFQLSARVTHVLYRDVELRRKHSHTISNLYNLRSEIVHTAKSEVSAEDLQSLKIVCLSTLYALAAPRGSVA